MITMLSIITWSWITTTNFSYIYNWIHNILCFIFNTYEYTNNVLQVTSLPSCKNNHIYLTGSRVQNTTKYPFHRTASCFMPATCYIEEAHQESLTMCWSLIQTLHYDWLISSCDMSFMPRWTAYFFRFSFENIYMWH